MRKKIFLCVAVFMLAMVAPTTAGPKKNKKESKTEERYQEIDNYDFLYTGGEYDFDSSYSYNFDVVSMENVMDEAFSHLGARYRHGAKGPYAFDCSGFTSYVYGQIGVQLSPSSRDQYASNMPISNRELQRGDLVFFSGRSGRGGVGHVGIVVDVDEHTGSFNFIHASVSRGVMVNNSNEAYYRSRYIGARRVK